MPRFQPRSVGRRRNALWQAVLRKTTFRSAKGGLLACERRPFATQKAVFRKTVRHRAHGMVRPEACKPQVYMAAAASRTRQKKHVKHVKKTLPRMQFFGDAEVITMTACNSDRTKSCINRLFYPSSRCLTHRRTASVQPRRTPGGTAKDQET